jgi:hypothetical protein
MKMETILKYKEKMEAPIFWVERYVDEIELLRLLFCRFFKKATNFSDLNVPSKHDNIYNKDEFEKSSYKKLITSILLSSKVVMMIEEEGARNFLNMSYQNLYY